MRNFSITWTKRLCEEPNGDCLYKLRICGGVSFRKAPMNRNCPYLYHTIDITPSDIPENITIPIRIRWPETPWHLTISSLKNYHDIIFESSSFYEKHTALDNWQMVNLESENALINFQFNIQCQPFMFGPSCGTYCNDKQPDPLGGHFKCSTIGDRLCAPNWSGTGCNEPICFQKCVTGQGNCSQPNVCSCNRGWQGASCEQCIPFRGCQHGYCNQPGECICHEHWTGTACDVEIDYCRHHAGVCLNGGTCSSNGMENGYYCNCTNDFDGPNCEQKKDLCAQFDCGTGLCVIEADRPRCYCPANTIGPFCLEIEERFKSNIVQTSATQFIWSHTLSSLLSLLCLIFGLISLLAGFYYLHRKKFASTDETIECGLSVGKLSDSSDPPPSYSLLDLSESRISPDSRKYLFPSTTV
ncbi:unnamed protein product [Auanema sp. JU1783]|nr:unnamed protein product [Auanema sp. JU1783]